MSVYVIFQILHPISSYIRGCSTTRTLHALYSLYVLYALYDRDLGESAVPTSTAQVLLLGREYPYSYYDLLRVGTINMLPKYYKFYSEYKKKK